MIRLAHLSDTHLATDPAGLVHGHHTAANLAAVVDAFVSRPDVAVVTGDLAEDGNADAYRNFRAITSVLAPEVHAVAGNHDDRVNMANVLDAGHDLRVVALSALWAMALLNSQWEGNDAGRIAPDTLTRLDEALARTTSNVVVCVHHPPLSTCTYEYCQTTNGDALLEVLGRHDVVRAVLSGHLHRRFDAAYQGIRLLGAPSTFRQLDHGGEPHFTPNGEAPAASMVELHDDGTVTRRHVTPRVQ